MSLTFHDSEILAKAFWPDILMVFGIVLNKCFGVPGWQPSWVPGALRWAGGS